MPTSVIPFNLKHTARIHTGTPFWTKVVRTRFRIGARKVKRAWLMTQVSHHGKYSIERLVSLEEYTRSTTFFRVVCVCAGAPLPIIILVISQEALPLANPTDGWAANWGFWVRAAILGGVNAVAISGHLKYLLQGIDETLCQLALQFVSVAVGYTAASVIVASLLVFPIPYMIIVMTPAFLVLLMGSMRAILGPTIFQNIVRNKAQFWRYTNAVYVQVLMAVTYPTYQALFNTVSGSAYELPVFLLLPVIKLVLKNLVALCLVGVDDLIPENVIFTVHFFNAVYLATSMQSASSTLAVVIVIIIDLTETSLALRGIYRRLNRIMNQLRCIIGPSGGEDTFLSATRSLCNFHEKFTKEERAQVQVRSFFSHGLSPAASEFLASLDNSALTFGPSFQSSTQSMPTIQTIPSDTKPSRFRVLFSQQWLEGAIVQPIDPTAKVNVKVNSVHNKQSRSGRAVAAVPSVMHIAILRKALATLFTIECMVLAEYVEFIIPLLYGCYVLMMVHLPSAQYHTELAGVTEENVMSTVQTILIYGLLELGSFVLLIILLKRSCGIQALYHFAFVLENQTLPIQSKMMGWMLITLGFRVVHFGTDFTFHFAWIRGHRG